MLSHLPKLHGPFAVASILSGALLLTFLAGVSGPLRLRHRGVYETPAELVGYVVQSVHWLIWSRFGKASGLAGRGVRVLDPVAGPANFLLAACRLVVDKTPVCT